MQQCFITSYALRAFTIRSTLQLAVRGVGHSLKCRRSSQWNLKYKILLGYFCLLFPCTLWMFTRTDFLSYLCTLTSLISSFSLFSRTLQVKKHHKNVKRVRFLWNLLRNLKYKRAWNMKFNGNLKFANEIWNIDVILLIDRPLVALKRHLNQLSVWNGWKGLLLHSTAAFRRQ